MSRDLRREFLKSQLRRVSALWPLTPSNEALDEYARMLWGFTDEEITAGFDHVVDTHLESSAPKPGHIRTAVGQVAKARRRIPPPEVEIVAAEEMGGEVPEHLRRAWREALGGEPPRRATPTEYQDGKPVERRATPLGDVVNDVVDRLAP